MSDSWGNGGGQVFGGGLVVVLVAGVVTVRFVVGIFVVAAISATVAGARHFGFCETVTPAGTLRSPTYCKKEPGLWIPMEKQSTLSTFVGIASWYCAPSAAPHAPTY